MVKYLLRCVESRRRRAGVHRSEQREDTRWPIALWNLDEQALKTSFVSAANPSSCPTSPDVALRRPRQPGELVLTALCSPRATSVAALY